MFTTAVIRGAAAQGYSSGQAMEIMEQIARDHLPDNIGLEWSGLSYQEKQAGGQTGYGDGTGILVRFPLPCCTIRKLDSAYCCVAFFTCGCFGSSIWEYGFADWKTMSISRLAWLCWSDLPLRMQF